MNTTTVTIPELGQTTLLFGARFRVRYGRDDVVLRDAELVERKANGDLIFRQDPAPDGSRDRLLRVRPSTITFLAGSGVDAGDLVRADSETASAFLDRAERLLGAGYTEWIGTDAGQAALASVATEDRANGKAKPKAARVAVIPTIKAIRDDYARETGDRPTPAEASVIQDRMADAVISSGRADRVVIGNRARQARASSKPTIKLPVDILRDQRSATEIVSDIVDQATPETAEKIRAIVDRGARTGRPYSERNQVWRCGSCKRRTRVPICGNGHQPVSAPAGKRRDDRTGK